MRKRTIGIVCVILLLLICGTVWALRGGEDPQVKKVRDMQKDMFAENLPPEQRRENMDQQISDFFSLPPEQRNPYLDKQLKDMENRRKQMGDRRPPN